VLYFLKLYSLLTLLPELNERNSRGFPLIKSSQALSGSYSPQYVHNSHQTLAIVMGPLFALQIDKFCNVTFLHYHFSSVFLKCCRGSVIYVIHIDSNSINFMLNSPLSKLESSLTLTLLKPAPLDCI
jgi:hypothetical protein